MASALLAAMRPQSGGEFDPALALKKATSAAPSYSMRQKSSYGNWQNDFCETFGVTQLTGDLKRETESSRESAPRYTMRPKTTPSAPVKQPGPGDYEIQNYVSSENHPVNQNAPVWQFGSTDRDKAHNRILAHDPKTPAPTSYNVTRDGAIGRTDQEAPPAYSMRPKIQDREDPAYKQRISPQPGAGEYDISHDHVDLAKTTAPQFSMRSKPSVAQKATAPSPDAYDISTTMGNVTHPAVPTAPGWNFGKTERDKVAGRVNAFMPRTPSPSHYNVRLEDRIGRADQETVASYSMRPHTQDPHEPSYRQKWSPRPGAGDYDITNNHTNLAKEKSPQYTMRTKPTTPLRSNSPAPGRYNHSGSVGNVHPSSQNAPVWQFGSSHRDNAVGRILQFMPDTPSPTNYKVAPTRSGIGRGDQEQVPSYSMRARSKDRRFDVEVRQKLSPRPGAHEYTLTQDHVDLAKNTAPKYSMRSRSQSVDKRRAKSPGPGAYDVNGGIGKSGRSASPMSRSSSGSAWGFGSSSRFKEKKPDLRIHSY